MRARGRAPARRRMWFLRAGAALTCLVAAATVSAPAAADPQQTATPAAAQSTVSILSLNPTRLGPGETATLSYVVTAFPPGGDIEARVEVGDGVRCAGDCEVDDAGRFEARLTASGVPAGETRTVSVAVVADNRAARTLTVVGPERVRTVRRVSGKVTDSESGEGIRGAQVFLRDGAGRSHDTRTGGGGRFVFEGSDREPITPGTLRLAAQAEDYSRTGGAVSVSDGDAASGIVLTLRPDSRPTPSPTPSAEPSPTEAASAPAGDEAAAPPPPPAAAEPEAASGSRTLFWVAIVVGVLMLALGVGGAVLLIVRRRQDRADDAARPGAPAPPRYPAMDDATAIVNPPIGPIAGADPMANAPTVVQQAIRDEYADPYGLPPRAPGEPPYGPRPGTWGATSHATAVGGPAATLDATQVGVPAGAVDATQVARPASALDATQLSGLPPVSAPAPRDETRVTAADGAYPFAGGHRDRPGEATPSLFAGLANDAAAPPPFAGGARGAADGYPDPAPRTHAVPDGYAGPAGAQAFGDHRTDTGGDAGLRGLNATHGPGAYAGLDAAREDARPDVTLARGDGRRPGLDDSPQIGDLGGGALPRRDAAGANDLGGSGGLGGSARVGGPGSDRDTGGTFHAFGPPPQGAYPSAPPVHEPPPSPYVPAGAPRPTGSSARYDEPTGFFRSADGEVPPLAPQAFPGAPPLPLTGQQPAAPEWKDD